MSLDGVDGYWKEYVLCDELCDYEDSKYDIVNCFVI